MGKTTTTNQCRRVPDLWRFCEPILQMIPSNDSIYVLPTTHTELPDRTDEDGDVAQEFYIEFGGKMYQYDPDILTAEQFLASLKEEQTTTMAEARPLAVGQPITLHHETTIRLVVERKEKIADLVQKDTKPPANTLKTP